MKITFFSSKPYDKEFFDKANKKFNFELDYFETHLGPHVLNLIENTDAVCAFVNDKLDAEVLEFLAKKVLNMLRCDVQVSTMWIWKPLNVLV
jgi:D-lactate dehydrogenase